jgi:hypothetical protein
VVCRAVSCLMTKRFRMSGLSEKGVNITAGFGADGISRIAHCASRRSRSAVALETKAFRIIRARGSNPSPSSSESSANLTFGAITLEHDPDTYRSRAASR